MNKALYKIVGGAVMTGLIAGLVTGCSGSNNNASNTPSASPAGSAAPSASASAPASQEVAQFPTDNVELSFYYPFGEDTFNTTIKAPLEAKYPNIKLNFVDKMNDEDISQGIVPDIMYLQGITKIDEDLMPKKLEFDLQPFIDKYGIDLSQIQPNLIKDINRRDGKLYGMPYMMIPDALFYNKDIFDKLGVEYPRDSMTWDEIVDLAKQVTRNEGGVQYRGLDFDYPFTLLDQYKRDVPDTVEPTFSTLNKEVYQQWMDRVKTILSIPGNYPSDPQERSGKMLMWGSAFLNDKNVAMYPYWDFTRNLADAVDQGAGFNWDLVSYPQLPENPGVAPTPFTHVLTVSPVSKYPDASVQVLSYLISEDYQTLLSKKAWGGPILTNPAIQDAYATEDPRFAGKNMKAMFAYPPADPSTKPPVRNFEFDILWNGVYDLAKMEKDTNTLLTEWQDQAAKKIQENSGK
ncbi:ABC transporter substrate-binding protein [Cohnella yongneupensis]|uniref:ABC transporter substrate-binding protein n=1 Tax=Cohnella yongneupensis TaxID=425006 RepID=A0ABW0R488_9BACL